MNAEKGTRVPERKREGLVVQKLDEEVLVYDLERHKAHCLNQTAAMIWEMCDGKRTAEEIAEDMKIELGEEVDEDVVLEAIRQLNKNSLLGEKMTGVSVGVGITRRELIKRIGIGAAIALPLVTSIAAPTAVQAQSCATLLQPCSASGPSCCPGLLCVQNVIDGGCHCDIVGLAC